MKKKKILKKINWLIAIVNGHYKELATSLVPLSLEYTAQWPGDTVPDGHTLITIRIMPEGSLYKVYQQYFLKGELQRENSWLASIAGQQNVYLMEIGGYRYCFFNPAKQALYLEDETIAGSPVVTVYHAQQNTPL